MLRFHLEAVNLAVVPECGCVSAPCSRSISSPAAPWLGLRLPAWTLKIAKDEVIMTFPGL